MPMLNIKFRFNTSITLHYPPFLLEVVPYRIPQTFSVALEKTIQRYVFVDSCKEIRREA